MYNILIEKKQNKILIEKNIASKQSCRNNMFT